jgi:hypothetical protein
MKQQELRSLADFVSQSKFLTSLTFNSSWDASEILRIAKKNTLLQELIISGMSEQVSSGAVEECFSENKTIVKGEGPKGITRWITINRICKELNAFEEERNSIPRNVDTPEEIEAFLKEMTVVKGEQWNTLKLIILGHGEVGKTTLLKAIQHEKKSWFKKIKNAGKVKQSPERTIGIDQSTLTLKDGEISVWDFGGQLEYAVTHQFFLSDEV